MAGTDPIAFLSYVQNDDKHESGKISALRERLEGELRFITGKSFKIFQDRNDIDWGQQWNKRITGAIEDVVFLFPVVTPSYFESPACRSEYEKFLTRERTIGEDRLIFPLYYATCEALHSNPEKSEDPIVRSVATRQWTDWRPLRFKAIASPEASEAIFDMASAVKRSISELSDVIEAARKRPSAKKVTPQRPKDTKRIETKASGLPHDSRDLTVAYPSTTIKPETNYVAFTTDYDEVIVPN